jgi:hypothetical protein
MKVTYPNGTTFSQTQLICSRTAKAIVLFSNLKLHIHSFMKSKSLQRNIREEKGIRAGIKTV